MTTIANTQEQTISTIAEEIRREHEACERDAESAVEHAIRAGKLLTEAKAQVQHGQWLPWLGKNFPFTQQTANGYMRIFEEYGRSRDLNPISVNAALKQISAKTYFCPKCHKDRSPSRFRKGSDRCSACVKEMLSENGSSTFEIKTKRQQQIADKAKATADDGPTPHFLPDLSDENAEENLRTQAIHLFEQGRRVASLLAADTAFVCRSKADRKTVIADADRLIGVATNLKESITCELEAFGSSFEITSERQQQIADKKPPTFYFGKGDKWKESTEPLRRYLAAWEKRGFEFAHLNPRQAAARVKRIDGLIDGLIAARADLEPRSEKATLTFQEKAR